MTNISVKISKEANQKARDIKEALKAKKTPLNIHEIYPIMMDYAAKNMTLKDFK